MLHFDAEYRTARHCRFCQRSGDVREVRLLPEHAAFENSKMSKQERAYATIRGRILSGAYSPGYRLTIDALARELGVSHVPVREAIRRLEAEGWVIYHRNAGPRVSPVDEDVWRGAMETLALLEGYANASAMPFIETPELERLRGLNAAMNEAVSSLDIPRFSRLNREFHSFLYSRCQNRHLVGLINETLDRLDAVRVTVFTHIPQRCRQAIDEHEELILAIEHREDFRTIEKLSRDHKLRTMRAYIEQRKRDADATPEHHSLPASGT